MHLSKRDIVIWVVFDLLLIIDGFLYMAFAQERLRPPIRYVAPVTVSVQRSNKEKPEIDHGVQVKQPDAQPTAQTPGGITVDNARGLVWVAEPNCNMQPTCTSHFQGSIAKYSQADGTLISEYHQPAGYSSPLFLAIDSKGNVWFTQPTTDAIGEFNPQTNTWNQWALSTGSTPCDLVFDQQGNLWFTEFDGNSIGFFNPKTRQIAENHIPSPQSQPFGMTIDAHNNIWFTENAVNVANIATFTPTASGSISIMEHHVTGVGGLLIRPFMLVADPTGNIWYTEEFAGALGRYNPKTNTYTSFNLNTPCPPGVAYGCTHISGIALDHNGNIWFTDSLGARVGYFIPTSEQIIATTLPNNNAHPHVGLAIDTYNTVWFLEQNGYVLHMWPDGKLH